MHRRCFNNGRELSRNSSAGAVRRKSALSRLSSGCRRRSRWCSQRERTGRVYRSGWKSRHDEYEDWANNAGFRVRRRLHSSSLTPYNTYVRETSASRTFLFLFFFLSFVGWLPVPRSFSSLRFVSCFFSRFLSSFLFFFFEGNDSQKQCVLIFALDTILKQENFFLFVAFCIGKSLLRNEYW